jgi:hypothetical protein
VLRGLGKRKKCCTSFKETEVSGSSEEENKSVASVVDGKIVSSGNQAFEARRIKSNQCDGWYEIVI